MWSMYFKPTGRDTGSSPSTARNPGKKDAAVILALHETLHRVSVGGDGRNSHFAVFVLRAWSAPARRARRAALFRDKPTPASSTHSAISRTPSPCSLMCSAMGPRAASGVVNTKRILSCCTHIGSAVARAGLRAAISHQLHAERGAIIISGLLGVADIKLDIIGAVQRKKIGWRSWRRWLLSANCCI